MTRDNMQKRKMDKPIDCMFCCELESIDHVFFECLVSSTIWKVVSDFFGTNLGSDYMSIARFWVTNKSHSALNAICAAVLWSIWKHCNALIFDGLTWLSMKQIWWLILRTIKKWRLLFKQSMLEKIDQFVQVVTDIVKATPALVGGDNAAAEEPSPSGIPDPVGACDTKLLKAAAASPDDALSLGEASVGV